VIILSIKESFPKDHLCDFDPGTPHSPGLTPQNFFLFPTMKNRLKASHFKTMEDIQNVIMVVQNSLHKMTSGGILTVGNTAVVFV
jgi:hypothetical protein